jgi:hypothetical protein
MKSLSGKAFQHANETSRKSAAAIETAAALA